MNNWMDLQVQVERTVTEFADITVSIEVDEYIDWLGGKVSTPSLVAEYLNAHRDYPQNLPLDGANWREHDVEIEVKG